MRRESDFNYNCFGVIENPPISPPYYGHRDTQNLLRLKSHLRLETYIGLSSILKKNLRSPFPSLRSQWAASKDPRTFHQNQ